MAGPQAGLKTGMYYLRTRAAADAIKFTVDQQALAKRKAARGTTTSAAKTEVLKVTIAANAVAAAACPPCCSPGRSPAVSTAWGPSSNTCVKQAVLGPNKLPLCAS